MKEVNKNFDLEKFTLSFQQNPTKRDCKSVAPRRQMSQQIWHFLPLLAHFRHSSGDL
jgi:hypothetical protein